MTKCLCDASLVCDRCAAQTMLALLGEKSGNQAADLPPITHEEHTLLVEKIASWLNTLMPAEHAEEAISGEEVSV